jgi:uncharacterized protein with von Willebrand factor type A (vWA) domain
MTDGNRSGGAGRAGPLPADAALPPADVAALAAALGVALRSAGLPAGPDRCERLARAVTVMGATTIAELHACALATMVSDPSQVGTFERVFAEMFGAGAPERPTVAAPQQSMAAEPADTPSGADLPPVPGSGELPPVLRQADVSSSSPSGEPDEDMPEAPAIRRVASDTERLAGRDFAQLSPDELRRLAVLMRDLTIALPPRRTRRYRPRKEGDRLDMRRTLRQARRTGGEPVQIARRAVRARPRRLIVLCDISGSMEPYARALLQLMYVASRSPGGAGGAGPPWDATRPRTEVFTFATRLTRLTPALSAATPETMLARAGEAAPDWAGGTRIGAALREFNDRYGARGMARGAVVLIISDGWETGDPAMLGAQMARLHRIAYRIVWANPRTQSERYRPEVGGMAAAWPYCDAVVSAHNFEALDDLLAALRSPAVRRAPATPSAAPGASGPGGLGVPGVPPSGAAEPHPAGPAVNVTPREFSLPLTQSLGKRWTTWR